MLKAISSSERNRWRRKKTTRISRVGWRNAAVYRFADGTTRKAAAKEKNRS